MKNKTTQWDKCPCVAETHRFDIYQHHQIINIGFINNQLINMFYYAPEMKTNTGQFIN